ncbi:MAG: TatD family hydrolase [Acidobacteriaceae bacterium]
MLVDSHAHLDSDRYAEDREAMLVRARQAGVETVLAVGIGDGPGTMHRALELGREYASNPDMPQIVASAGIHPHEAELADAAALERLDALAGEPEIVAVGEIGLDYFYDHSPREVQVRVFVDQMDIAAAHKLPILIHCRASADSTNAWDDALDILHQHWRSTGLGGVLHCFAGEQKHAKHAMDMGFLVSFAGNITFPKAQPVRDVAAKIPADRLLVETDAPFLSPVPYRGQRNEPARVRNVAEKLAEVRGVDYETMALTTTENFHRFFGGARASAGKRNKFQVLTSNQ